MKSIKSLIRDPISALGRRVLGTITSVSTSYPVVALTFDDGPHPHFTPRFLEVLKRHKARATFFMLGKYAKKYPDVVASVARDGHAIGNHSWDHQSFPLISSRQRRRHLISCKKALEPYGLRLFRPPFGDQTLRTRLDAFLLGYQVIAWDIAAFDWLDHDAYLITERVEKQIRPGSIVLFHDRLSTFLEERYESRDQSVEALNILLGKFGDHFRFVTVPELLTYGQPIRVNWRRQSQQNYLAQLREPGGKPWRYSR